MVEVKKGLIVIISGLIILAAIGVIWLNPLNKLNADEFFTEIESQDIIFNQNDTWTLHDKVDKVYQYYLPELDLINKTVNYDENKEYTAIKFKTSYNYLKLEGNQTQNFTIGDYATHVENIRLCEGFELLKNDRNGNITSLSEAKYVPQSIYNSMLINYFSWFSEGLTRFDYSTEILNETALKVTITDVWDYYPYPIQWNQVKFYSLIFTGSVIGMGENITVGEGILQYKNGSKDISLSANPELISLFNISVYQNDVKIYDIFYPDEYDGNHIINEGQYLIIDTLTSTEISFPLYSLKFCERYEQPNVSGLGWEFVEFDFVP